jgi:hypothetical protein
LQGVVSGGQGSLFVGYGGRPRQDR